MDTAQILVTAAGAALVVFILWFFFGARETTAAKTGAAGVQEVDILVKGGYSPDRITVEAGRPVRLNFLRQESTTCTEQVVLPDFNLIRTLPEGQRVPVEFTPEQPGEFPFHCAMNMVRGRLTVTPAAARGDA